MIFFPVKKIEQIVPVQVLVLLYFLFFSWASYYLKMKARGRGFLVKENLAALTSCYVYKTCIDMKFLLWNVAFHISVKWTSGLKFYQIVNFVFIYIVNICLTWVDWQQLRHFEEPITKIEKGKEDSHLISAGTCPFPEHYELLLM